MSNDSLFLRATEAVRREDKEADERKKRFDALTRIAIRERVRELLGPDFEIVDGFGPYVVVEDDVDFLFMKYGDHGIAVSFRGINAPRYPIHSLADIRRAMDKYWENLKWNTYPGAKPQTVEIIFDRYGDAMCPKSRCHEYLRCTVRPEEYDSPFSVDEDGNMDYEACASHDSYVTKIYCPTCGWTVNPDKVEIKWKPDV